MSFIDEHCLVFDLEEENKLEYTQLHIEFMTLVDKLLCELLEDLGVTPETMVSVLSDDLGNKCKISSFVLTSVLSVEDFLQFKAMMVKRNVELTNQVIESLIEKKAGAKQQQQQEEPQKHAMPPGEQPADANAESASASASASSTPRDTAIPKKGVDPHAKKEEDTKEDGEGGAGEGEGEGEDDEIMLALKLSQEQFEIDNARRKELSSKACDVVNGAEGQEDAFEKALAESLKIQSKMDQERAELEQALALSLALQKEAGAAVEEADATLAAHAQQSQEGAPAVPHTEGQAEDASKGKGKNVEAAPTGGAAAASVGVRSSVLKAASNLPPIHVDAGRPSSSSSLASSSTTPTPQPLTADPTSLFRRPSVTGRMKGAGYSSFPSKAPLSGRSAGGGGGASSSAAAGGEMNAVREAAYAAAETQKGLLQTKKDNLLIRQESQGASGTKVGDLDTERKDFIIKQRAALVAKNNAQRQQELAEFLLSSKENLFPKPRQAGGKAGGKGGEQNAKAEEASQGGDASQDEQRAALRHELAKMFKQQLLQGL